MKIWQPCVAEPRTSASVPASDYYGAIVSTIEQKYGRVTSQQGSISRIRFGRNLRIKTDLVKFKFVIITVYIFEIP
jgi:hypothetical protein